MATSYSEAGVDIAKVRSIQDKINEAIFAGKKGALVGHYAGIVNFGGRKLAMHTDGVGSKVLVAQDMEKYDTVGIDAIAMNVNDLVCVGARPIAGVDYIALSKEDGFLVGELLKGLMAGAQESGIDIIGGETAILPDVIKGGSRPFDLAFTVIGEAGELITGESIKEGDVIIGLESSGLHSNGYSLARKVLDVKKWGAQMLAPTKIYVKPVLNAISSCRLKGIAHITGGAFSKLTRLNKQKGFLLNSMPKPAPIFEALNGQVDDEREMHRTFNMGIGMCMIIDKMCEDHILSGMEEMKKAGISAMRVGEIIAQPGVYLEKDGKRTRLD